jgi:hypothetical protein
MTERRSACRNHYPRASSRRSITEDLAAACHGDADALVRLHKIYGTDFTQSSTPFDLARLREKIDERFQSVTGPAAELTIAGARLIVARQHGFATWDELLEATPHPFCVIHKRENEIVPGPVLSPKTWNVIADVVKERRLTSLNAAGRITDDALKRLSKKLDTITRLNIGGCLQLTDEGLAHLPRMPQLRELVIDGWKGQITDKGLEVLRHLPELRKFEVCWQQNISDEGLRNLAACEHLEDVNLLGTPARR